MTLANSQSHAGLWWRFLTQAIATNYLNLTEKTYFSPASNFPTGCRFVHIFVLPRNKRAVPQNGMAPKTGERCCLVCRFPYNVFLEVVLCYGKDGC